jgi:hypothetical protein
MASISQLTARLIDLFGSPATANPSKLAGNLTVSPNGNILVGSGTDDGSSNKLQVTGTARITGTNLYMSGPAATYRVITYQSGSTNYRWQEGVDNSTETGSNVGSDYYIWRYNDAGALIDAPISIKRSNGMVTVQDGLTVNSYAADTYAQVRMITGNYGVMLRNDGGTFYLLSTPSGSQYGNWNTLRPFYYNLATGAVNIDGTGAGTTHGGSVTVTSGNVTLQSGSLTASGNVVTQNGNLWSQGYSGNANAGVLYLGNSGGNYIYQNGSSWNFNCNLGTPYHFTANAATPMTLSNSNVGNYWVMGPDGANAYCIYNSGGAGCFLSWGSTAWGANSDERLKNIKEEITGAVNAVEEIRTIKYTWKKDDDHAIALGEDASDSTVFVGVIAQDVQKVLPEAVTVGDNGYLAVKYSELTPLALAAIKELHAQIQELRNEIDELKGLRNG